MKPVVIESEAMRVGVLPAYGARVVTLLDKRTGREWLQQGGQSANTDEGADYLADEAVGWDECFPTVSPWDATNTPWQRPLRNHGDLWGRPWTIDSQTASALTTSYVAPAFRFSRMIGVEGAQLTATYTVVNRSQAPLPYLWALHGLLIVTPEDRIVLPDVATVTATYLTLDGRTGRTPSFAWPDTDGVLPFALDEVQPASRNFAGKLYASNIAGHRAVIGHGEQYLVIGWDEAIDHLGIWLNYGAWPSAGGGHHIALEPTTAAADHLGEALATGNAVTLAPGASTSWTISMTLSKDAR